MASGISGDEYKISVLLDEKYERDSSKYVLDQCSSSLPVPLPTRLAETRAQRIESVLATYIDPLLTSQGFSGLFQTTFLLVPSSVSSLKDVASNLNTIYTTLRGPQVVGFSTEENKTIRLVQLAGEENTMEFWGQPTVLSELESSLKKRLRISGHHLYETGMADTFSPLFLVSEEASSPSSPQRQKLSLWERAKRKTKDIVTPSTDVSVVDHKLGWRTSVEQESSAAQARIPTGLVAVSVVWRDLHLRMANDAGLYETRRGPGLCLTVEVGS